MNLINWKNRQDCFIEGLKGNVKLFINVKNKQVEGSEKEFVEVVQSLYIIIPINKEKNLPQNTIKILPQNPEESTINGMKLKAESILT